MPAFARYVGIDYSGAATPTSIERTNHNTGLGNRCEFACPRPVNCHHPHQSMG